MNLCSEGHEEICYEARTCPLCETIRNMQQQIDDETAKVVEGTEEIDALADDLIACQKEREGLRDEVKNLRDEVKDLQDQLFNLEAQSDRGAS